MRKTRKTPPRKWVRLLHLWIGLLTALPVFIIALSGALYVFKNEIQHTLRRQALKNPPGEGAQILPIKALEQKVIAAAKENYKPNWVEIPLDKTKPYRFTYYEQNPDAFNYFEEFPVYKTVYISPHTGKITGIYDERNGFFNIVKYIHWSFLLKSSWGKYLTGIPVLLFMLMMLSGLILWWPKNKAARKQRTWFRWGKVKTWKRKAYDLHSILGFYSLLVAIILSFTGLFYAFTIVQQAVYYTASGGRTQLPDFSKYNSKDPVKKSENFLDKVSGEVDHALPQANYYSLDLGNKHLQNFSQPACQVYVNYNEGAFYKSATLFFDRTTAKLLYAHTPDKKNFGEVAVGANYDLHVGAILGWPTKVLAFLISLIIASLPITGTLIWLGRFKKIKPRLELKI